MSPADQKAVEVVVFKLRPGATREQLLGTNAAVSEWAARQPGFLSRDLAYDAEGDRWIDVVWWRSLEDAHAAAESAMGSEACAPMFALIDEDATLMVHGEPVQA